MGLAKHQGGGNATLSYTAKGFRAGDKYVPASSFKLNGFTCGSEGGANRWKLQTVNPIQSQLSGAEKMFLFIVAIATDVGNSPLQWLWAVPDDPGEEVLCGAGRRLKQMLWVTLPDNERKRLKYELSSDLQSVIEGGVFLVMNAVDAKDVAWTCVFEKVRKGSKGEQATKETPQAGVVNREQREAIGAGEIIGIVVGCVGTALAIVVVIIGAILWRRQKNRTLARESQPELHLEACHDFER